MNIQLSINIYLMISTFIDNSWLNNFLRVCKVWFSSPVHTCSWHFSGRKGFSSLTSTIRLQRCNSYCKGKIRIRTWRKKNGHLQRSLFLCLFYFSYLKKITLTHSFLYSLHVSINYSALFF